MVVLEVVVMVFLVLDGVGCGGDGGDGVDCRWWCSYDLWRLIVNIADGDDSGGDD